MVPVMVWAKGRFYKDWWFPIFDGYVMSVEPSDNNGFAQLTITCRDLVEGYSGIDKELITKVLNILPLDLVKGVVYNIANKHKVEVTDILNDKKLIAKLKETNRLTKE